MYTDAGGVPIEVYCTTDTVMGVSPTIPQFLFYADTYNVLSTGSDTARNLASRFGDSVNVKDFGAIGDGVTDDRESIQNAINYGLENNKRVVFPAGIYALSGADSPDTYKNGLFVPPKPNSELHDYKQRFEIEFMGGASLIPLENNMCVFRFSHSYTPIYNVTIEDGGKDNIIGFGLMPEDIQTTASMPEATSIIHNSIYNLCVKGCTMGIRLQSYNATAAGAQAGCYYNNFYSTKARDCDTCLWISEAVGPNSTITNRNNFFGGSLLRSNCGVKITGGDTNKFVGIHFEQIDQIGSLDTPTAIYLKNRGDVQALDGLNNAFISCVIEACDRDVYSENRYNSFIDTTYRKAFSEFTNGVPFTCIGGNDPSTQHQSALNLYARDTQGTAVTATYFSSGNTNGKLYVNQNHALNTGNTIGIATIKEARSRYSVLGDKVNYHARLNFSADAATDEISIFLPIQPDDDEYEYAFIAPMSYPVVATDGRGSAITAVARMAIIGGEPYITIKYPTGDWNVGEFNSLWIDINYRRDVTVPLP